VDGEPDMRPSSLAKAMIEPVKVTSDGDALEVTHLGYRAGVNGTCR
jgi:hypothetical protein